MGDVQEWVARSCAEAGLTVTSAGEQTHDRPWSCATAFDVRDDNGALGRVWLKVNGAGTSHEPGLISALSSLEPDLVPTVLAVDLGQSWSLTRDAGRTWRSAVSVTDQSPLWESLLQRYAAAQLTLAAHRSELLATGAPERSPATLGDQAADLISELTQQGTDSGGVSATEAEALAARLPAYRQRCRDLDSAGFPSTLQHDDLHANNVCGSGLIIDWGDASIGHPFGTMVATLRSLAHHGGCDVEDPRVLRVRDAYLEPFTTFASGRELAALVDIAQQVGAVTRALAWRAALLGAPPRVHRTYDFPVRGWVQEILALEPRQS